jgi:hypothetical protein
VDVPLYHSGRETSLVFVVSHCWIARHNALLVALGSKGSCSLGSRIAGLPPQSKCGFRFAPLCAVGLSEPTPAMQVKFFHRRHLRVFRSIVVRAGDFSVHSCCLDIIAGDPSAHCTLFVPTCRRLLRAHSIVVVCLLLFLHR